MPAPIGRGKARGAEFVRGAHRETELRKKLKPTQPANSSVRPWKGGVPIYKVQFGGGANYLLATHTRTAPVHADRKATLCTKILRYQLVLHQNIASIAGLRMFVAFLVFAKASGK